MQTKLTLRMDEGLVIQAKEVAKLQGKSVSQIVADYFVLITQIQKPAQNKELPITLSLRGLLAHADLKQDNYREQYREHLLEKYR